MLLALAISKANKYTAGSTLHQSHNGQMSFNYTAGQKPLTRPTSSEKFNSRVLATPWKKLQLFEGFIFSYCLMSSVSFFFKVVL